MFRAMMSTSLMLTVVACGADVSESTDAVVKADDIPVAHTPDCGWKTFPPPVLATCTEPIVDGGPDLRGLWQNTVGATKRIQRIEQCGNRVVITSGGVIHDMRADGTLENGVNDVSAMNCQKIRVSALFVDKVLVLSPEGMSIKVKRWLEGDELVVDHPIGGGRFKQIDALP